MKKLFLTFIVVLFCFLPFIAEAKYHIDHRIALEGNQGWDWLILDENANRLYITRGTEVDVMDLATEKIIGTIKNLSGVHGVALVSTLHKGFVSNGKTNTVTSFDLKSYKTLSEIPVGKKPDAILYDSFSKRIFAFNGESHDSTVIDVKKDSVLQTIPLNAKPEFAVSDEKGNIFVNLEDKNSLAVMDAKQMKLIAEWPLTPCESPSGLAIDQKNHRLFSVCENEKMIILNSDTGAFITSVSIGKKPDAAAFEPVTQLAFSPNGEGTLSVVQEKTPDQFEVIANVATQKGARTMALNSKTHSVYLITAKFSDPLPPTATQPHPRPSILPGTVEILVMKN
ncbi:MAG: YncE family protein [Deltaproteobacteria bacterium]|nr:YncE family protein [Deltaproteobacteria bacterium]